MANIEVGVRGSVPQDVDIMEVRCWHGGEYIADSVQRQGGSRMQRRTKWALIYATRVWPGFESRYRSLSTPRLGFYRYGLKDHSAYACGSHSGLPGRRKTAYQVP